MPLGICSSENKNLKRNYFYLKKVLIMALNDTFHIVSKRTTKLETGLTLNSLFRNFWEKECKKDQSRKECLFYCD